MICLNRSSFVFACLTILAEVFRYIHLKMYVWKTGKSFFLMV